jgi:hypothetical protein
MSPDSEEPFNLTGILQRWKWPRNVRLPPTKANTQTCCDTLQLAAEREIAAGVLAELSELLERNAPFWYAEEQHERVESALELLQRL